jgi:hypothetical protein
VTGHDLELLERLRADPTSAVVAADDPTAVAEALVADGARRVPPEDVTAWADEAVELRARAEAVLAAEEVLARTRAHERARRAALVAGEPDVSQLSPGGRPRRRPPLPAADRQALRFSLGVLVLAQLGGIAVYVADRSVVAVALPAVAIAGVLAVHALHRRSVPGGRRPRSRRPGQPGTEVEADPGALDGPVDPSEEPAEGPVLDAPAVRAAEAHLRRRQAAWKLAWWERDLAPTDVGTWLGGPAHGAAPATLVVVDDDAAVDPSVHATMTAALPAAVRVVLIRSRPREGRSSS